MKGIICEHTARTISNKVEILIRNSVDIVYIQCKLYIYIYGILIYNTVVDSRGALGTL